MTADSMPQPPNYGYRPVNNLVLWTYILIAANVVCYVVALPLNAYVLSLVAEMKRALQSDEYMDPAQYAWMDQAGSVLMVTSIMLFVLSAILVACWINRAHKNSRALGVKDIRYSPAMAVGSFFIPIVSLFMPYQLMKQMVSGSLVLTGEAAPRASLLVWWVAYLVGSFSNRISAFMAQKATFESQEIAQLIADIDKSVIAVHLENIACICLGISAGLLFVLIRRTERAHGQLAAQQGLRLI